MSPTETAIYEVLNQYGYILLILPLVLAVLWLFWRAIDFEKFVREKEKKENIRLPSLLSHGWRGKPCPEHCDCRKLKRLYYQYQFEAVAIFLTGEVIGISLLIMMVQYFK